MNQMYLLLLGILGVAAIGSLLSSDDDEEFEQGELPPDVPAIDGTDGADTLAGTDAPELIRGLAGNDRIDGAAGDDWIYGGEGSDSVAAAAGDDRIFLGAGDDVYGDYDIGTDEGSDTIEGGSGDDTITVNDGTHVIWGDDADGDVEGDDSLTAYGGQVTVHGGADNDTIAAHDGMLGSPDVVDALYGEDGDDLIEVGSGDLAEGGEGTDTYRLTHGLEAATLVYDPADRIVVSYRGTSDAPPDYEVVQAGSDAQLVVGGSVLATLKNTDAGNIGPITFEAYTRSGGGYVAPVTDPEPVVVVSAASGSIAEGGAAIGGIAGPMSR